jgi:hypothetical protein
MNNRQTEQVQNQEFLFLRTIPNRRSLAVYALFIGGNARQLFKHRTIAICADFQPLAAATPRPLSAWSILYAKYRQTYLSDAPTHAHDKLSLDAAVIAQAPAADNR